jgi:phytanoyl-CoA hydroxylase
MPVLDSPTFHLGNELTKEQVEFFDKNGVLLFKNFLQKEAIANAISETNRIDKEWIAEGRTKVNGVILKFGIDEHGNKLIQRSCFLSLFSPVLHEVLEDQRLKALLPLLYPYEGRIGENEKDGLVFNHYIRVPNGTFSKMGWHTDCPRDLFFGQRIMPMLNVGIHLDDCSYDNGGLRVLLGTHKQNILGVLFGKRYYTHNPDKKEVGFNITAGDLTVHDGRIWHRVQQSPNFGEKSRRRVMYIPIITGKYMPKHERSRTALYQYFR